MKTFISLSIIFSLMLFSVKADNIKEKISKTVPEKESVAIGCSPELYDLATVWVAKYNSLNQEVNFTINLIDKDNSAKESVENLILSPEINPFRSGQAETWNIVVGRLIIVPVINSGNPLFAELTRNGVSPKMLSQFLKNQENKTWGTITGNDQTNPVHIFISNEKSVINGIAGLIGENQLPVSTLKTRDNQEIITAVQNDVNAIGFINVAGIINDETNNLPENISLLPIDKNGNGTLDYFEEIYSNLNQFMRGVWIGKYSAELCQKLYASCPSQPENKAIQSFLDWVITDGQQYTRANGYCELIAAESQLQADKIFPEEIVIQSSDKSNVYAQTVIISLAVLLILGLLVTLALRYDDKGTEGKSFKISSLSKSFDINSVVLPRGLFFDKTHTWVFMESDGQVKIGIDNFLQHITGRISRIEMKNPGEKIRKGELLLSIVQSGKQLNIYAPVSGVINAKNDNLKSSSSEESDSTYTQSWIYLIEPTNWFKEIQLLEMADKYEKFIVNEFNRLKDFLSSVLKTESPEYQHCVLQDGGKVVDGVLENFGPRVWEDFQTDFLDQQK